MVEGITPEHAERSIYAYVEEELGKRIATSKRTICMEVASESDRQWLDIEGCTHVACVKHSTYDSDALLRLAYDGAGYSFGNHRVQAGRFEE